MTGEDGNLFEVDMGTLSFRRGRGPDFEEQRSYSITIKATSGEGERRLTAELDLTVGVLDTEDEGEVELSYRQPHVGIDLHATASDPDGGVNIIRWLWERSDVVTRRTGARMSSMTMTDPNRRGLIGRIQPEGG